MTQDTEMLLTSPVAQAFDTIAETFDRDLENSITRRIRLMIYETIEDLVEPGSSLLDINCGTGIDAINLDQRGYRVTGLDLSPKMIEQAKRKVGRDERADAHFLVSSYDRVPFGAGRAFELAFSNFGGLNCAGDLTSVAAEMSRIIVPMGYFLGVVMPPFSLWESLSYVSRGKWSQVFRRLRRETLATGFGGKTFVVRYHSPSTFIKAFEPWFELQLLQGICVLSPTPQSASFIRSFPRLTSWLQQLDSMIGRIPPFRSMGDHYLVVLKRKPQ